MEDIKYIREVEEEDNSISFDPDKLNTVFKRLLPWILLTFLSFGIVSFLIVRYTKPLFESESILKLDIKRDASILGLNYDDEEQSFNSLSSEIELLKSRLFFNKIIDATKLDVSIYTIGNFLVDERYYNPPFNVEYIITDPKIYDRSFRVDVLDEVNFSLSYNWAGIEYNKPCEFGKEIETDQYVFKIELTEYYIPGSRDDEFFFILNSRQSLLNYFEENITVQPLNLNANTIQISFIGYNRFKIRDMVNAIDTLYLKYTRDEKTLANSQKILFIDQQLASTEQKLTDFEDYFEKFIIDNQSVDLQNNLAETIMMLSQLDSQRYRILSKISHLKAFQNNIDSLNQINLSFSDYQILPQGVIEEIMEFNNLLEKRESVLISYNTNTQVYRKWSAEIASLYSRIRNFIAGFLVDTEDQLKKINRRKSTLEKSFVELPSKNTDYSKSQRYYALYDEFYLTLMQKKAEFQLAMAGTVTDFKILSAANLPVVPLKPQPWLVYGLTFVLWVLLSFFMVGIGYLSFNKIIGLHHLERSTGIPILGTIPFYSDEKISTSKLLIDNQSNSALSEALRSIRTNMQFVLPAGSGTIASISSTVSGEGKTFTGLNISGVFALSGKKVLLMDMDLRKPKLDKVFENVSRDKGISTILIGKDNLEDCIVHSNLENLDILASGPIPPNPSELIMGEGSVKMFAKLREKYDLIVMDTPPIGIVTDGVLVMKKADIQIYIVRAEYSKVQFIPFIEKLNTIHKFPQLYLILNSVKSTRGVHYGYGYGSGYYQDKPKSWFQRIRK